MLYRKLIIRIFISIFIFLAFCFFHNISLAHKWVAPQEASIIQNPIPYSEISVAQGKDIYSKNCMNCHGVNAEGLNPKTTGLKQWTSNLVLGLKNHSDGDFFWKIQNGKGAMPSFRNGLSENDIWNLINFIKSLEKQNKYNT